MIANNNLKLGLRGLGHTCSALIIGYLTLDWYNREAGIDKLAEAAYNETKKRCKERNDATNQPLSYEGCLNAIFPNTSDGRSWTDRLNHAHQTYDFKEDYLNTHVRALRYSPIIALGACCALQVATAVDCFRKLFFGIKTSESDLPKQNQKMPKTNEVKVQKKA